MSDSLVSLYLVTSDNPCPDCVSLQWGILSKTEPIIIGDQLPFVLLMRFKEQEKSLLNGHLKFGIKGAILTVQLEDGEIIEPLSSLDNLGQLQTHSPSLAIWQLISPTGVSILQTESTFSPLAVFKPFNASICLTITLTITPSDLSITNAEGLWRHDIHPNQHAILDRVLAWFLYKNRLSNYLCRIKLTSDQNRDIIRENKPRGEIDPQALAQLHQLLNRFDTADTQDLLELTALGNLDPLKDLAGGNFLAGELSGVALSGAILSRTNFRGANLTDADLSEALLNYSRFSGADLSGSLLGNAQLVGVDFYRASLALANLIGANLTGANLQEANLSQTNFSGATVTGAKFGQNLGMTEKMKASLAQKGAIFLDNC